jgi:hypothetical protein
MARCGEEGGDDSVETHNESSVGDGTEASDAIRFGSPLHWI